MGGDGQRLWTIRPARQEQRANGLAVLNTRRGESGAGGRRRTRTAGPAGKATGVEAGGTGKRTRGGDLRKRAARWVRFLASRQSQLEPCGHRADRNKNRRAACAAEGHAEGGVRGGARRHAPPRRIRAAAKIRSPANRRRIEAPKGGQGLSGLRAWRDAPAPPAQRRPHLRNPGRSGGGRCARTPRPRRGPAREARS